MIPVIPLKPLNSMTPYRKVCVYLYGSFSSQSYTHTPYMGISKIRGIRGISTPQTPSYQVLQLIPVKNQRGISKNQNRCNAVTATVTTDTPK